MIQEQSKIKFEAKGNRNIYLACSSFLAVTVSWIAWESWTLLLRRDFGRSHHLPLYFNLLVLYIFWQIKTMRVNHVLYSNPLLDKRSRLSFWQITAHCQYMLHAIGCCLIGQVSEQTISRKENKLGIKKKKKR